MLDLPSWKAPPGGPVGLIFGDQPVGDIIAVVRALFDCVARCHPVAVVVKQHAGEQVRLVSACAGVARGGIGGKLLLNRIPQRLIDDRRVFAGVGLSLVNDLAPIETVLQYQVERTAREWLAADQATRGARPRLASDPSGLELLLQQPNRAEFGSALSTRGRDRRITLFSMRSATVS